MTIIGEFHDQGDAKWIVIREQSRGHNDTPFGRPTPGRPFGRPGIGLPASSWEPVSSCRIWWFKLLWISNIFINIVPFIMKFTHITLDSQTNDLGWQDLKQLLIYCLLGVNSLLRPVSRPPPKLPYGCFWGCPSTGWVACGRLLPPWIPHALQACKGSLPRNVFSLKTWETETRRELPLGEAIWGQTNQPTDGLSLLFIEALARALRFMQIPLVTYIEKKVYSKRFSSWFDLFWSFLETLHITRREHSASITPVGPSLGWSVPILLCPRRSRASEFLLL